MQKSLIKAICPFHKKILATDLYIVAAMAILLKKQKPRA
jgi:hypothetical protein